jgi:hypothetical protein
LLKPAAILRRWWCWWRRRAAEKAVAAAAAAAIGPVLVQERGISINLSVALFVLSLSLFLHCVPTHPPLVQNRAISRNLIVAQREGKSFEMQRERESTAEPL